MGHIPLLDELSLIAALAVTVTVLLAKLRLPTVAGLLAAGALAGPNGLALVRSTHSIEMLAEVGVVLLLFTIGLEFSLERLTRIFRSVALGGLLQVVLTGAATAVCARLVGLPWSQGVFYGFVVSLSSTAIVLRALGDRNELDAPHGRFIVGTLIFQDLAVVPMVLIVPILSPEAAGGAFVRDVSVALGKAALLVVVTILIARVVVPRVLTWVDASRSRETFLIAVLGLCIGTAWLTSLAGLSLALGAFLGGMVVAGTAFGHRAMGDVLPLRDAFVSLFFVSLGMLFDVRVVFGHPIAVLLLTLAFLVGKAFVAALSALAMGFPARVALLAGVGLAQFGEFGFVLAKLGETSHVVSGESLGPLLAAGIVSMFLTPVLVRLSPHFAAGERLLAPLQRHVSGTDLPAAATEGKVASNHVVVVGYGLAGRMTTAALDRLGVGYVVMELNAETVRQAAASGVPAFYADATSPEALEHAHLASAKALVLLINDRHAVERIVDTARRVAPQVPVVTRARYATEGARLRASGAADVIVEEIAGAVEIVEALLSRLEISQDDAKRCVDSTRSEIARSAPAPA